MKKLILFLSIALFASCGPREKKVYNLEVIYTNGDTSNVSYRGLGNNYFTLENSDLKMVKGKTLISGVRSYRVISIKKLGLQTESELKNEKGCVCTSDVELIPNEEE